MRMTRLNIAIATFAFGLAAAPGVQAQDTTRKASAGEVALAPTYATLLAAINGAKGTTEQVKLATMVPIKVRVVDAKLLVTAENRTEFGAALNTNKEAIVELRAALEKHDIVVRTLRDTETKYAVGDVVAAQIVNHEVVLFVHRHM